MDATKSTLIEVEQKEQRADELAQKLEDLRTRDVELSRTLAEAHANGTGDTSALKQERREVRDEIEDLTAALPLLRKQITQEKQMVLLGEIERRLLGTKKAHGSLLSEYPEDVERFQTAGDVFREAGLRLIERHQVLGFKIPAEAEACGEAAAVLAEGLRAEGLVEAAEAAEAIAAEAKALAVELARVQVPAEIEAAVATLRHVLALRLPGRGSRPTAKQRQQLLAGTRGAELLALAGPTEAEKAEAARQEGQKREREERERRELEPFAREIKQLENLTDVPLSRF